MEKPTALIAGATGLIGQFLLQQLLLSEGWGEVRVLGRSEIDLSAETSTANHLAKLKQQQLDFDQLDQFAENSPDFFAVDAVFCCLGTTLKTAGSRAAFERVDHDYVIALAQAGARARAKRFLMVSAIGADPASAFFYNRIKGKAERAVQACDYDAVHFFQPSLLLGDRDKYRDDKRPGEAISQKIMPAFTPLLRGGLRRYRPVQASEVATALCQQGLSTDKGVMTYQFDGERFVVV